VQGQKVREGIAAARCRDKRFVKELLLHGAGTKSS
jgi:hypothetical protein